MASASLELISFGLKSKNQNICELKSVQLAVVNDIQQSRVFNIYATSGVPEGTGGIKGVCIYNNGTWSPGTSTIVKYNGICELTGIGVSTTRSCIEHSWL